MKIFYFLNRLGLPLMLTSLAFAQSFEGVPSNVITRDNDDFSIDEPKKDELGDYIWWDGGYHMFVYQAAKPLDPAWLLRKTHVLAKEEAENINTLDEVPDSTWFTNRHGAHRLSQEELTRGPNVGKGPSLEGPWTVFGGKSQGISSGFFMKDARGDKYLVKFDPQDYPGLGSNCDVIGSKILYAAGYNTPEYGILSFDPSLLRIAPDAKIKGKYKKERPLTEDDLKAILAKAPKDSDGRLRAGYSLFLKGKIKGAINYQGTRKDDPNDTVRHENRRELRALRVLMAWLNNTDARRGNTMDVYVDENGKKFLKHYHLDFSASMGSGNIMPKETRYGHEYFFDPPKVGLSTLALGAWVKPWETDRKVLYPEVGRFDSDIFEPEHWLTTYANPAFEKMTPRDAFWGAKIVTAFTDEDLRAIVHQARYDSPGAEDYVVKTLAERRDKIGRAWLENGLIAPLDNFALESGSLRFEDLSVLRGYARPETTVYRIRSPHSEWQEFREPHVALPSEELSWSLQVSRDGGAHWTHVLALSVQRVGQEKFQISGIRR